MKLIGVKVDSGIQKPNNFLMELISVALPFGKNIYQFKQGQSVSEDNTYIVETILKRENEEQSSLLDLGCGNGILSIMLGYYRQNWKITGIEIQSHLVELAGKNSLSAEVSNISFHQADLRKWDCPDKFDLIIGNPPYFPEGSGRISPIREKAISRHEILCNMNDVLIFIKKFLKPSGRSYLIYPSKRLYDMEKNTKKVDLNIEEKFFFNRSKKEKIIFCLSHLG